MKATERDIEDAFTNFYVTGASKILSPNHLRGAMKVFLSERGIDADDGSLDQFINARTGNQVASVPKNTALASAVQAARAEFASIETGAFESAYVGQYLSDKGIPATDEELEALCPELFKKDHPIKK